MIRQLVQTALRHPAITLIATLGLIVLGIWAWREIKIEAYPDISDTQVVVVAQFPGHAAEEMEQQVTIPIERVLGDGPCRQGPPVRQAQSERRFGAASWRRSGVYKPQVWRHCRHSHRLARRLPGGCR